LSAQGARQPDGWAERFFAAARAGGATQAELFLKIGRGRKLILEPGVSPGAPPLCSVTTFVEQGMALRVQDERGREGFAWQGMAPGEPAGHAAGLALAAITSLQQPLGAADVAPMAPRCAGSADAATDRPPGPPGIADAEVLALPQERIEALLRQVAEVIATEGAMVPVNAAAGSAVLIDRLTLSEATTSIRLANTHGFEGRFDRSLVLLTVSLLPAVPGATAVVEERSACRLADIDPLEVARESLLRALPARAYQPIPQQPAAPTAPPEEGGRSPVLLLTPRAAASLVAGLAPRLCRGDLETSRNSALTVVDDPLLPARPGSAPFDGAGHPTSRTVLLDGGRCGAGLSSGGGHFIRASYRDRPVPGPAGLLILPAGPAGTGSPEPRSSSDEVTLRVAAIDLRTGGRTWRLRLRRADWWRDGASLGSADGLLWEGTPEAIIASVSATFGGVSFFHCGLPVGAPGLRLQGLGPFLFGP
jgi:predicted Zn-dependent protease